MYRWVALVLVLLLAGCSSSSTLPAYGIHATNDLAEGGGTVSGHRSGAFTFDSCGDLKVGDFTFNGLGWQTFIGKSYDIGVISTGIDQCTWSGTALLVSVNDPGIYISVSITQLESHVPCDSTMEWTAMYGTGKFANVTGSGQIHFHCDHQDGEYTENWSGTLNF